MFQISVTCHRYPKRRCLRACATIVAEHHNLKRGYGAREFWTPPWKSRACPPPTAQLARSKTSNVKATSFIHTVVLNILYHIEAYRILALNQLDQPYMRLDKAVSPGAISGQPYRSYICAKLFLGANCLPCRAEDRISREACHVYPGDLYSAKRARFTHPAGLHGAEQKE